MKPSDYPRGQKHSWDITFHAAGHGMALPVILVRGAKPGKTLVVTAGVHGDEYEGVRAIFDVTRELDPSTMSGDLLCVPVCNPPAFWDVTRCSPLDGANLARVFPGSEHGSPTEAIAWQLDHNIIAHADFYLDLHSAGVRCLMPTMIGYYAGDPRAEAAARVFGAPVIWAHDSLAGGRTVSAAMARDIPWLYTEARGAGRIDDGDLAVYHNGILRLMQHLEILPGTPEHVEPEMFLFGDGNVDGSITTKQRGFLVPAVRLMQPVAEGATLGYLYGLHGETLETFVAPCAGIVALIHICPLINGGDPLFLITQEKAG